MRRPRTVMVLLLGFTATACADLSAVRDFAKTSNAVAREQEAVLERWPAAFNLAKRQAATPQLRAKNPELVRKIDETIKVAETNVPLALEVSKTLKAYFDVLASLADDSSADVSAQASSILSNLGKLGVSAPRDSVGKLAGRLVQVWQSRELATLIKDADPDVQVLTLYLSGVAVATANADQEADSVAAIYWSTMGGLSSDPAVRALVLNAQNADNAVYQGRIAQANAAEAAFKKIGEDHAHLKENANILSRKEVAELLKKDIPILIAAVQNMQRK